MVIQRLGFPGRNAPQRNRTLQTCRAGSPTGPCLTSSRHGRGPAWAATCPNSLTMLLDCLLVNHRVRQRLQCHLPLRKRRPRTRAGLQGPCLLRCPLCLARGAPQMLPKLKSLPLFVMQWGLSSTYHEMFEGCNKNSACCILSRGKGVGSHCLIR